MPVNSISANQPAPAPASQVSKVAETVAARKKSEVQESNKVKDREIVAERQAQLQKFQEANKLVVNTSGQKTGTRINTAAWFF